jgi:hypothetical protein
MGNRTVDVFAYRNRELQDLPDQIFFSWFWILARVVRCGRVACLLSNVRSRRRATSSLSCDVSIRPERECTEGLCPLSKRVLRLRRIGARGRGVWAVWLVRVGLFVLQLLRLRWNGSNGMYRMRGVHGIRS